MTSLPSALPLAHARGSVRSILCLSILLLLAACGPRSAPVSVSAPSANLPSYIDLKAGWRLRAIVPLTKSGAPGPAAASVIEADSATRSVTVAARSDFLGYETQYYTVTKRGRGVHIRFDSATSTKNGQTAAEPQPSIDLFPLPPHDKYVRLVYLLRASRADHNMAVVAASQLAKLEAVTHMIQNHPPTCASSREAFCAWIPTGIAVRPELQQVSSGASDWVPVR